MMKSIKKNLLSVIVCCCFIFMALASSKKRIPNGVFNENKPRGEVISDTLGCLILNNGERVYGSKIWRQSGAIVKDLVRIDGQKFPMKEVKGYYLNGMYYGRYKTSFPKRVLYGKINIYYMQYWHSATSRTQTEYIYWQKGEDGDFNTLRTWKHVKQAVKDCPLAYSLANRKNGALRREVKKNEQYLWRIFEIYNNNCKAPSKK